ncbi:MAG: lasso RiPP family leader peptide-containing protein [Thermoanaerobaculia bacterium]
MNERAKQRYETPTLDEIGTVEALTGGQGWNGDEDQWWFFTWGQKPGSS